MQIPEAVIVFIYSLIGFAASVGVIALFMRVVPKERVGVLYRLGRPRQVLEPGPKFVIPLLDRVVTVDMSPSEAQVAQNVVVRLESGERFRLTGSFNWQIADPLNALKVESDPFVMMQDAVREAAAAYVEKHGINETATRLKELNMTVRIQANDALAKSAYVELSKLNLKVNREK